MSFFKYKQKQNKKATYLRLICHVRNETIFFLEKNDTTF